MAKKRRHTRQPSKPAVPFEWETEVTLPGGKRARLARPEVEQAEIDLDCGQGADGEVITRRARVWRTKLPPVLSVLNPAARAAVMDYAEAVEAVGGSGGGSLPTGAGGGSPGTVSPSHRALIAAERLRAMRAALSDGALVVPLKDARRMRRGDGLARVPLHRLADWVALDGASRTEILRRAGAAPSNEQAQEAATLAIVEVGARLATCCGYTEGPTRNPKLRNMPERDL